MAGWLSNLMGWGASPAATEQSPHARLSNGTFYLAPRPMATTPTYAPPSPVVTDPGLMRPLTAVEASSATLALVQADTAPSVLSSPRPSFLPPKPSPSTASSSPALYQVGATISPSSWNTTPQQAADNARYTSLIGRTRSTTRPSSLPPLDLETEDEYDDDGDTSSAPTDEEDDDPEDPDYLDDESSVHHLPAPHTQIPHSNGSGPSTSHGSHGNGPSAAHRSADGLTTWERRQWRKWNGFSMKGGVIKKMDGLWAREELPLPLSATAQQKRRRDKTLAERNRKFGAVKRGLPEVVLVARLAGRKAAYTTTGTTGGAGSARDAEDPPALVTQQASQRRPTRVKPTADDVVVNAAELPSGQVPITYAEIRKVVRAHQSRLADETSELPMTLPSTTPIRLAAVYHHLCAIKNAMFVNGFQLALELVAKEAEFRAFVKDLLPTLHQALYAMGLVVHGEKDAPPNELPAEVLVASNDPEGPVPALTTEPLVYTVKDHTAVVPAGSVKASLPYTLAYFVHATCKSCHDVHRMAKAFCEASRRGTTDQWREKYAPRAKETRRYVLIAWYAAMQVCDEQWRVDRIEDCVGEAPLNPRGVFGREREAGIRLLPPAPA